MNNPIPMSLTKPYRFSEPLDFDDARDAAREISRGRRQAREWKQAAMQAAAEAEHSYRKARAHAWARCPSEKIAKEKEDWVNAETVDARQHRDIAVSLVKAADERLEEIDADRSMLNQLMQWSMKVNPLAETTA